MANPFDQFDPAPAAPTPAPAAASNPFDQFDAAASAPVSAAPTGPDRPSTMLEQLGNAGSYVNGLVRSAANSVPIIGAYADKLDAATDSALSGKSAEKAMSDQKAQDQTFAAQNPVSSGAAGFAGAAGGSVAALPEWGLGAVGGLGSRVVGSAVGGTTLGTADALARGDDPGMGAATGFAGGVAGPLVAKGVGAGIRGVTGLMAGAPAELQGTGRLARSWLQDGVAGVSPEDYAAAKGAVGPAGMFAEMSPKLTDYAGSVADNNGTGKAIVRGALDDRFAGRNGRVNDLVSSNFGPVTNPTDFRAGTQDQISQLGAQRAAMLSSAGPVDVAPVVQGLQDAQGRYAPNSQERSAIGKGLGMVTEPAKPATSAWELDPAGSGGVPEMPSDLPEPPPYSDQTAPSRPGPVGVPRPPDLHAFIRSAGGMQDPGGDLAAMGYGNLVARPGQGLGPDAMRQAAAQSGYLGANIDEATAQTGINDLHSAIASDNPIHSVFDQDAAAQWADRDAAMADYQRRGSSSADPVARPAGARPSAPGMPASPPGFDPNAPTGLMSPIQDATQLHNAKQNFGKQIEWQKNPMADPNSTIGYAEGAYKDAYGGINDALRGQVSGYGPNQDAQASLFSQNRALDAGLSDLQPNSDPARYPPTFAQTFDALSPEEQVARRAGQRFSIEGSLGNRENDLQATRSIMQGEGGWNSANLAKTFGQEPVDNTVQGLNQEVLMAKNRQTIAGGSPTGEKVQRSALTQPWKPEGFWGGTKDYLNKLHWDALGTYLPTAQVSGAIKANLAETARQQIAPHLVKSGPEADALFQALSAQRHRQAVSALPSASDPLVQALMLGAGQYAGQ